MVDVQADDYRSGRPRAVYPIQGWGRGYHSKGQGGAISTGHYQISGVVVVVISFMWWAPSQGTRDIGIEVEEYPERRHQEYHH